MPAPAATRREPLTDRQREVFDFVVGVIAARLRPPSYREIMAAFGYGSTVAVVCHLRPLEKKGYLRLNRNPGGTSARGLEVVGLAEAVGEAVRAHARRLLGEDG